jgi:hypothetical protein
MLRGALSVERLIQGTHHTAEAYRKKNGQEPISQEYIVPAVQCQFVPDRISLDIASPGKKRHLDIVSLTKPSLNWV